MQQEIFTIRDSKAGSYGIPFYSPTPGTAERQLRELTNDPQSMVHKYPEDYDLYKIGSYNQLTGNLEKLDTPQHICKAISLKKQS